jgi:hypothetical protein
VSSIFYAPPGEGLVRHEREGGPFRSASVMRALRSLRPVRFALLTDASVVVAHATSAARAVTLYLVEGGERVRRSAGSCLSQYRSTIEGLEFEPKSVCETQVPPSDMVLR